MISISKAAEHVGLFTVLQSPRDIHLILLLRCIRLSAFGAISLILVHYLQSLGIHETMIGVLLTCTVIGDLVLSFLLALVSDKLGRKRTLVLASCLMLCTGIALYWIQNFYFIVLVMVLGVVTPSGGEVGPFRSVEQSIISSLMHYEHRSDIFSWYTFVGGVASGIGNLIVGYFVDKDKDFDVCFVYYSFIGAAMILISLSLSDAIEIQNDVMLREAQDSETPSRETTPLMLSDDEEEEPKTPRSLVTYLLPQFSPESIQKLLLLTFIICLDSLGMSLSSKAWTVYYFDTRYHFDSATLGLIFGFASFIGAIMALVGTYFCKKFGPIRTMLASHTSASILLVLHSLPINGKSMVVLFITRAAIRTMDLPSKHVFISAAVEPQERTAAIGFINASKTMVNTIGPVFSGFLASRGKMWFCFLLAGFMRLSYDLGLFIKFWDTRDA